MVQNLYPPLRRVVCDACYVVKPFTTAQAKQRLATHPEQLSLNEMYLIARSYPVGSPEFNSLFTEMLFLYPDNMVAKNNLAAVALDAGNMEQADRCLESVRQLPEVQNNLGILLYRQGNVDEANIALKKLVPTAARRPSIICRRSILVWLFISTKYILLIPKPYLTMKIKSFYLPAALLVCLASCSEDDTVNGNALSGDLETAVVKFEMNAKTENVSSPLSRVVTLPDLTKENFRIMAFKKSLDSDQYLYAQDVPMDGMTFGGNALSGAARLPIGEYKFVSTYGLVADGGFALPTFTPKTTVLSDDLNITHGSVDGKSVFFLEESPLESLHSYVLGTNSTANEPVKASLPRAVSRVDILFIQAKKIADGVYTEVSDSDDVFGVSELADIEMQFAGLNKNVNLVGDKITTDEDSLFSDDFKVRDLENTVTRGTSDDDTKVGTTDFVNYDEISGNDIKIGSAHVHGTYVLPFDGSAATTTLTLLLTNKLGDKRTIAVPGNLKLERNKVTLVKIYVLSGTVFNTDVQFNVDISTAWLNANTVSGEIN